MKESLKIETGLSKRELFTAIALHGILDQVDWHSVVLKPETIIDQAIVLADKTIEKLQEDEVGNKK